MIVYTLKNFQYLSEENYDKVTQISFNNWDNNNLFLDKIYDCVNLESLTLYRYQNLVLDARIGRLKKLKKLHISSSQIKTLPDEIQHLSQLVNLKLDGTPLTNIPEVVFKLKQLENLNLSFTPLAEIPESIKELSQLKELSVRQTNIESLPDSIAQLSKLETLDFGRTHVPAPPSWLGKLKNLKLLSVPSTKLATIPYFYFKLKKLVYYNIPAFEVEGVDTFITDKLREYLKRHVAEECAQAFVHLMTNPNKTTAIAPKYFVEVCNINDKEIAAKARAYLKSFFKNTLQSHPICEKSEIAFLGQFEGLDQDYVKTQLKSANITSSTKVTKTTTHVVLCYENKRKFDPTKHPNIVLLSNQEMIAWMKENEGAGYLEDDIEGVEDLQQSIIDLLLANNMDSIKTAIEMLKSGGIAKSMILPLIIAYSSLSDNSQEKKDLRRAIRETLYRSTLSDAAKKTIKSGLSKAGFSFHPRQDYDERLYKKRLERKGHPEFEMVEMAKYYFKTERRGYQFMMESRLVSEEEKIDFIKANFIKGTTLDLSNLSFLKKVPEIISHFKEIEAVDLRNGDFSMFPAVLRDGDFPKLKSIDLRENLIDTIPKNVSKKMPNCKILLSE